MIKKVLFLFLLTKVFILYAALTAPNLLPLQDIGLANTFSIGFPYLHWVWGNFDGVNYVEIARAGYHYPNFAYFPLYPLLMSLVRHTLSIRTLTSGLIVSNVSLLLSLFLLYRIARLDYDKKIAWRSIVLLLVFPTAFFYSAVYADSLFLLLSTASFFAARKSKWFLAGVCGGLASATRLVGVTLLVALALEWYLAHKEKSFSVRKLVTKFFKTGAFWMLLIPMGMLGYLLYLQIQFGNFLLFQKAMVDWHQSKFVFPPQVLFRYMKILFTASHNFVYFVAIVELIATIAYFVLSVYVFKKVRTSYGIFMLLILLIPTFTGTFQSMPRYILHLFPAFIALSIVTSRSKRIFWATVIAFLALQGLFVALFTRGYFIS